MQFYTAPSDRGSIVQRQYCWDNFHNRIIRCIVDRSDRTKKTRALDLVRIKASHRWIELDSWELGSEDPPEWLDALIDRRGRNL